MFRYLSKSFLLLLFSVAVVCVIYPLALWFVGQRLFPFQANGSLLTGPDGKLVGSVLIAQPFTKDEYFQPRPSAASYDASASASSALAASNYALRDRVARTVSPIAKYASGSNAGQSVGSDVEKWFVENKFQGKEGIVAQWANLHNSLAQAWVNADPSHATYVDHWAKEHPQIVKLFIKDNPGTPTPKAADLAVVFFQNFSQEHPGKFPIIVNKILTPASRGSDIQAIFFDMWLQDHPEVSLQEIPGDYVTTSASGLDPHITLQNAYFQLDRVAAKWAEHLKRSPEDLQKEIHKILTQYAQAPWGGLIGEEFVNVLEVNLELNKRYRSSHSS